MLPRNRYSDKRVIIGSVNEVVSKIVKFYTRRYNEL